MNPQSKAREFWIAQGSHADIVTYSEKQAKDLGWSKEPIHVIEKSAYDKAVEALKVISQYTSAYSGASSPEANLAKETLRELGVE